MLRIIAPGDVKFGLCLMLPCALSACDMRGGSIPYDRALPAPAEETFLTLPGDYTIAPMDTVTIRLFQGEGDDQKVSGDYQVDLAGHVSLPLIGQVEAANLTTAQLDARLTQLLGEKYFEHPDLSVAIKQSTAHAVTVDGAVVEPGRRSVAGPTSLVQAIAMARGAAEDANLHRIAIFRTIGGQTQAAAFDLAAIRHGEAPDPTIYPGDIIIVDGSEVKAAQKKILAGIPLYNIFSRYLPNL